MGSSFINLSAKPPCGFTYLSTTIFVFSNFETSQPWREHAFGISAVVFPQKVAVLGHRGKLISGFGCLGKQQVPSRLDTLRFELRWVLKWDARNPGRWREAQDTSRMYSGGVHGARWRSEALEHTYTPVGCMDSLGTRGPTRKRIVPKWGVRRALTAQSTRALVCSNGMHRQPGHSWPNTQR